MRIFTRSGRPLAGLLVGLLAGAAQPALAQVPSATQLRAPSAARAARPAAPELAYPRLDNELKQLAVQTTAQRGQRLRPADLQAMSPDLHFAQGRLGATVLVRITARDVNALLPRLRAQGFEVSSSYPQLHFVEGMLPVSALATADNLAAQGLLGIVASYLPESNGGAITSQADYVLEAARARATQPRRVTGTGINVGVLSDSFNALGRAAAGVASGDLPQVNVLSDAGTTDEGRGMCELIYDLAPGSGLAFSTANGGEGVFAQHIRDLADPTKGNCRVIVDDVRYFAEPMFQDGVIAQAITDVVNNRGVVYFSSAGNYADKSYENTAPQFVATSGSQFLNFDRSGATSDVTQRVNIANSANFRPVLQWSDPFYTVGGVQTDLDMYLVAVRNGVSADTVARSTSRNITTSIPVESFNYTNVSATTNTTTFDLVIRLRSGATPSIVKYINYGSALPAEWLTSSSTATGHSAVAEGFSVAAVPYYNQRVAETFSSKGGSLRFLFAPDGTPLATPAFRQKPDIASIDGTNTTFFGGSDYEADGFPNFFGTSAAAPHAAAVAALLRSSEPSLTAAQVYARLVGSARLLGTTATDPITGPGLLDAYTALYGAVTATAPPVLEDLEKMALPVSWRVSGTAAARAQVSNQAPASGSQSLVLDAYPYITSRFSLNEATLFVQNAGSGPLSLSLRTRKFVAELDDAMPTTFAGSSNSDGVALSVDGGLNWYRILDLTGTNVTTDFQTKTVNLTQFATDNGLTLGTDVRLKFQQYGRGGSTNPTAANRVGRVFDDIVLTQSAAPAPVVLLAYSPVPAAGCPGLQVQYSDTSLFRPTGRQWTFPGGTPATSTDRNPLVTYNTPGHYGVTLSVTNANGTVARTDTGVVFVYGRRPAVAVTPTAASICSGATVTFGSTVTSCGTTTYNWQFPGGTPASSTAASPGAITYSVAGNYTATLTVTNDIGSVTTTVPVYVDGRVLPYAESFDNSISIPQGWALITPSTFPWALVPNIVGRSGTASNTIRAPFARDNNRGEYPSINTPAINLAGLAAPKLRFDLAYAPYAAVAGAVPTDTDSLIVRVLDACSGAILGNPYMKGAQGTLATMPSLPYDYIPAAGTDWRQELVDLTPYAGRSVIVQFRGYNDYGNHLYIDNVTVGGNILSLAGQAAAVGLEAWPNPTPTGAGLHLRLPAYSGAVGLRLIDNLGRAVWQQQLVQTGASVERVIELPLAPGLYNLVYTPATGPLAARRIVVQ